MVAAHAGHAQADLLRAGGLGGDAVDVVSGALHGGGEIARLEAVGVIRDLDPVHRDIGSDVGDAVEPAERGRDDAGAVVASHAGDDQRGEG
jgi:hypothetical protein